MTVLTDYKVELLARLIVRMKASRFARFNLPYFLERQVQISPCLCLRTPLRIRVLIKGLGLHIGLTNRIDRIDRIAF